MVTLLVISLLSTARPNPYLAQAKVFFQGGDYKSCLKRIEQAQKWESSVEEQVDVALYGGLCNFQLRNTREAESDFALALKLDPQAKLPPLTSPKAVALFEAQRPKAEPAAPPPEPHAGVEPAPPPPSPPLEPAVAAAEPAKPAVKLEEPPPARAPIVPILLAGAGVASAGFAAYFGASSRSLDGQARAAEFQSDSLELRGQASKAALAANLLWAAAGVLVVSALLVSLFNR